MLPAIGRNHIFKNQPTPFCITNPMSWALNWNLKSLLSCVVCVRVHVLDDVSGLVLVLALALLLPLVDVIRCSCNGPCLSFSKFGPCLLLLFFCLHLLWCMCRPCRSAYTGMPVQPHSCKQPLRSIRAEPPVPRLQVQLLHLIVDGF